MLTIGKINKGESEELEFKSFRSKNPKTFIKTNITISNGKGGRIVFGIDNNSEIIGIDPDTIYSEEEAISNIIDDMVDPQIIPEISIQDFNNKKVIIMKVYPGSNRPYHQKNQSIENNTYVRIGNTTRKASFEQVKELISKSQRESFCQEIFQRKLLTNEEINKFLEKFQK